MRARRIQLFAGSLLGELGFEFFAVGFEFFGFGGVDAGVFEGEGF